MKRSTLNIFPGRSRSMALGLAILLALLIALAAGEARAYSFLDQAYGTVELGIQPRVRAMGGAGSTVAMGSYSLVDNPAMLVDITGDRVDVDGYLARTTEDRLVPVYDTFDAVVTENAIAVNESTYGTLQGGLVVDLAAPVVLSAGVFNRYDPRYDYFDEIRAQDTSDALEAVQTITTEGIIRSATVGAALPITGGHGVGVAVNYYWGDLHNRSAIVPNDNTDPADVEAVDRSLEGYSFTLGGVVTVSERIRLGLAFETKPSLSDDYATYTNGSLVGEGNGDLNLPLRVQGGFTYRPRNTLRTSFAADLVYMNWSDVKDDLAGDVELRDTWQGRFGVEHVFYNDLAGRLGFRYGNSYAMENADVATLTFGFGYLVKALQIDIAAEVNKRDSRQEPVRERTAPNTLDTNRDRVQDTWLRLFVGLSVGF